MTTPEQQQGVNIVRVLTILAVILGMAYVAMFGFNSLTRTKQFSPDSMIYVDVARNVAEGRGLTQSALGIHEHRFLGQQTWPIPFTSQPLYPLLIAGLSRFGITIESAALILPATAMAGVLVLAWLLLFRAWGREAAWLGTGILVLHFPLRFASRLAWSDAPGVLLVLAALLPWRGHSLLARAAFAGLCCGLAFAMRYALAPLGIAAGLGILLASRDADWRKRTSFLSVFALCAAACALPVLLHNAADREHWHPEHLEPLNEAVFQTFGSFFGDNFARFNPSVEGALLVVLPLFAALLALRRNQSLRASALPPGAMALVLWIGVYLAFIVYISMTIHLDNPGIRLLLPATVPLMIWIAGFIASATRLSLSAALIFCTGALALRNIEEAQILKRPAITATTASLIAHSPRLTWIKTNVGPDDVVIGEETMDIPFFMGPMHVGSFSAYPTTEYPTYQKLMDWTDGPGKFVKRVYLVLRKPASGEDRIRELYGDFIGDVIAGKLDSYPRIMQIAELANARVYEVVRP